MKSLAIKRKEFRQRMQLENKGAEYLMAIGIKRPQIDLFDQTCADWGNTRNLNYRTYSTPNEVKPIIEALGFLEVGTYSYTRVVAGNLVAFEGTRYEQGDRRIEVELRENDCMARINLVQQYEDQVAA